MIQILLLLNEDFPTWWQVAQEKSEEFNKASYRALVDQICAGQWPLPHEITQGLAGRYEIPPGGPHLVAKVYGHLIVVHADPPLTRLFDPLNDPIARLTEKNKRVLKCMMEGLTTRQMMRRLGRKRRYIYYQLKEIKQALGVKTRQQILLAFAQAEH